MSIIELLHESILMPLQDEDGAGVWATVEPLMTIGYLTNKDKMSHPLALLTWYILNPEIQMGYCTLSVSI